jgi:hypothetical protein
MARYQPCNAIQYKFVCSFNGASRECLENFIFLLCFYSNYYWFFKVKDDELNLIACALSRCLCFCLTISQTSNISVGFNLCFAEIRFVETIWKSRLRVSVLETCETLRNVEKWSWIASPSATISSNQTTSRCWCRYTLESVLIDLIFTLNQCCLWATNQSPKPPPLFAEPKNSMQAETPS